MMGANECASDADSNAYLRTESNAIAKSIHDGRVRVDVNKK